MWETDWSERTRQDGEIVHPVHSAVEADDVEKVYLLHWREHCVECAPPDCYQSCRLYVRRRDEKCARFKNGIAPNTRYCGLYGYGAEIQFRRWGKLESNLAFGPVSPDHARRLARADANMVKMVNVVAAALEPVNRKRRLNGAYAVLRNMELERLGGREDNAERFDEFVMEVFNLSKESYSLILEIYQNGPRFRVSLQIHPGHNLHRIPCHTMNVNLNVHEGRISVRPDQDVEAHVVFTWLDFVRFRTSKPAERGALGPSANSEQAVPCHADKVKCVVWDLDNTLWRGILVEDGIESLQVYPEALDLIRQLDERGIMQSVASKNDHEVALDALARFGLKDYFLYPAINWGPKSAGIRAIADNLNLGLDSFAFIDDSPVERAQVKESIPQIRVYAETEVAKLAGYPEMDVPVTAESRQRRLSYLEESQRKVLAEGFADIDAFLRSCDLRANVFTPSSVAHFERCIELLQRSNQLNLTTHRYTEEELRKLLDDPNYLSVATACCDRFGEYGIVGFAAFDLKGNTPLLTDFVLSCRVAKKKVENAWFQWVAGTLQSLSFPSLQAIFIPTKKNNVLLEVLHEVGFRRIDDLRGDSASGQTLLELPFENPVPSSDIVRVADVGVRGITRNSGCLTVVQ